MTLNYVSVGTGSKTVVLLHGMAGSLRYWEEFLNIADKTSVRYIAIDLLGFGNSAASKHQTYTYDDHISAVMETLAAADISGTITVVGHSMGALIGLRLASIYPEKVERLVLCGLPYYPNVQIARQEITNSKLIWRLAYYGKTCQLLCNVWCRTLRPVSQKIAPMYLRYLPKRAAADSVLHSWRAYSESLKWIIEQQDVVQDILKVKNIPAVFLYGDRDQASKYIINETIIIDQPNITIEFVIGAGHHIPVEAPDNLKTFLMSK